MRRSLPVHRHTIVQVAVDVALVATAFYLAFELRFLDHRAGIPDRYAELLASSVGFVVLGKVAIFAAFGMYEKWWRYIGARDLGRILQAAVVSAIALVAVLVVVAPFDEPLPRSVAVMDFLLTFTLVGCARLLVRLLAERPRRGAGEAARRILVVGAGSGGQSVVREMQRNPEIGERPIGFVDDDPRKRRMRVLGLRVLGTTDEISRVLDEVAPEGVVIAIPSAPGTLRGRVVAACRERNIAVRTLPTTFELLLGGHELTRQLREVQVEDVLGREPVAMELDRVGAYLTDRVVMVTGAGGSIGSELVRQIALVRPRLLVCVDHAEDNLFEIEREMLTERHFSRLEAVLGDCKEPERMLEVTQRFRPAVVFHAAAYKHVPMMEANPLEAIRNNAIATRVVADTAAVSGAERFVLVSTDKAVNPRTVMGASKAMAEWVVQAAGVRHPRTRFASVRFGNVLGSSGSVVPLFRRQIEQGGPVTVTDPEMSRYFMTIPEAVQLVIAAGDIGASRGEVFVLEMGEPVRIIDLAHKMIALAGYEPETDIAVEIVGPRPGEKLHEQLLNDDERRRPTANERITRAVPHVEVDPAWVEEAVQRLEAMTASQDEANLAGRLVELVAGRSTVPATRQPSRSPLG